MRRGNCQFGTKVLAAQNQGAIAVIVVIMLRLHLSRWLQGMTEI
ncbi:hypothetical protein JCM19314_361 [Nonlabens ulvanivorans]|uniref:PA domain-containing protein n=1 Tax=Nonlabens ulvanivorans TaxID=906888 RepID=A0A090QXD8_NONUL|nr:hypothetical protein JCM19314_361 [Nonlabens ulvanivorans]